MQLEDFFSHPLLASLWEKFAHLPALLRRWDGQTLKEIAADFLQPNTNTAPVSTALLGEVLAMTTPLFGQDTARALTNRLSSCPAVLSANYHCVECIPEMVQALHFFGLHDLLEAHDEPRIIPVLSCGSVSLQSPTYPRGLTLARHVHGHPVRLPFFSSAFQDVMVCQAPPLQEGMLKTMHKLWRRSEDPLEDWEQKAVDDIVDTHILRPDILGQPSFSLQASRINASLCAARYPEAKQVQVVYLEMESLVARLLATSLGHEHSLMHQIFFDQNLRQHILHYLAGVRGCWQTSAVNGPVLGRTGSTGTIFFWLADHKGRRCPLRLNTSGARAILEYKETKIVLEPETVCQALKAGQLIPSLFTIYTSLTLEHGLRCYGGIFLADYLPAMVRGVRAALAQARLPVPDWTEYNPLTALPLTVQIHTPGGLLPAGGVELMATDGLTHAQLQTIGGLTIIDVLPASLASWYQEYIPMNERPYGWEKELACLAGYWKGVVVLPNMH